MRRECLSFLKLDRSQTYLAFPLPFLSSRVARKRQSHRDFACRFKGLTNIDKVKVKVKSQSHRDFACRFKGLTNIDKVKVKVKSQSHRDFACRFKGLTNIDKVNYNLQLFPSIIRLNKLSLLYD